MAKHFLALGWIVRGITRSATSSSAASLSALGVQLVEADIDDPSTLIPAFRFAHVIFAVTDCKYLLSLLLLYPISLLPPYLCEGKLMLTRRSLGTLFLQFLTPVEGFGSSDRGACV